MPDTPVTRREFDRLEARLELILREGTPKGAGEAALLQERVKQVADGLEALDKKVGTLVKIMGSIALTMFTGLVSLIVILISRLAE